MTDEPCPDPAPATAVTPAEELRAAAEELTRTGELVIPAANRDVDLDAGPVVAWLRSAAEAMDRYPALAGAPSDVLLRVLRDPDQPPAYRMLADQVAAALEFARSVAAGSAS